MRKNISLILFFSCSFFQCAAQADVSTLTRKFNAYQSVWAQPALILIFNQEKFSKGDTVWFKTYFLKEDLTGVQGKQIINVDLIDADGISKFHFLFNVNNGLGHSQFKIPDNLPIGLYLITAHSNWMRNFNSSLFFKKQLSIVEEHELKKGKIKSTLAKAEGGHLIAAISNRVSIRTGQPNSDVQIIDASGVEVTKSNSDLNGVATAIFTPATNALYFARVVEDTIRIPLPPVEEDGFALLLAPPLVRSQPIRVEFTSPVTSSLRNEEMVVFLSSKGKIYHTATFIQRSKEFVEILLPHQDLPEGIVQVSLLNHNGILLASRDFYKPGESAVQVNIEMIKRFHIRDKVRLEVSLINSNGIPVEGEFAVSVQNSELFGNENDYPFSDQVNILSHLKENIHIDKSNENWLTYLDNYLITKNPDVAWSEIMAEEIVKPRFNFTSVLQKSGTVYNAETMQTVPDLTQLTFYLQRNKMVNHTFTVEKGKVWLTIPDIYEQDEIFYMAETKGKQIPNVKIIWDDEPLKFLPSAKSSEGKDSDPYGEFSSKRKWIDQSFEFSMITGSSSINSDTSITNSDFEEQILGADITVTVQNYVLFPEMRDLVKEIIPSMYHRKIGGKDMVRVKLPEAMNANITGDAVFVIDGIVTKNINFFLSLKPSDVITIKVVRDQKKLAPFGLMGKNGIVIVQTKKGNARELADPSNLIEGISKPKHFYERDYSTQQDKRKPDFRSTLFWNPIVKTGPDGKTIVEFFCSDDVGKMKIRINGFTKDQVPFSVDEEMEVVDKNK